MTTWSEITCFLLGKASSEVDGKGRGERRKKALWRGSEEGARDELVGFDVRATTAVRTAFSACESEWIWRTWPYG